jgi:hypothetical protein
MWGVWKSYPEFNMSPDQWMEKMNDNLHGARVMHYLNRALRRAVRDKVITMEEKGNLWKMISATDEDCYTALLALESKYKLLKQKK